MKKLERWKRTSSTGLAIGLAAWFARRTASSGFAGSSRGAHQRQPRGPERGRRARALRAQPDPSAERRRAQEELRRRVLEDPVGLRLERQALASAFRRLGEQRRQTGANALPHRRRRFAERLAGTVDAVGRA